MLDLLFLSSHLALSELAKLFLARKSNDAIECRRYGTPTHPNANGRRLEEALGCCSHCCCLERERRRQRRKKRRQQELEEEHERERLLGYTPAPAFMGEEDDTTLKGSKPFILDVEGEILVAVKKEDAVNGAAEWEISPGVYAAAVERAVGRKNKGWGLIGRNETSMIEGRAGMGIGHGEVRG